jgi:hypothetical protein
MRASTISGEAFKIQRSLTANFLYDFVGIVLKRRNAEAHEGRQELGPGKTGYLGGLGLRNALHFVPLDRGRQAHLTHKAGRVLPDCGKYTAR